MTDVKVQLRKPVSWLDPAGLARTGIKAVEASLFGSFADRRETIAALSPDAATDPKLALDYSCKDELWFDYIADTGDGWNSTYSIAWLACADKLVFPNDKFGAEPHVLHNAHFTILGGDEVYPTASLEDYKSRLTDPFYCASDKRSASRTAPDQPHVYALPGNHDWYDGLTSFMRLFLQGDRKLGPWMTGQSRTYFAIKLPYNWWLWGVDVQLESDVDAPQVDYFQHFAKQLTDKDRVILCTPEPSWVEGGDDKYQDLPSEKSKTHSNLVFMEKLIIARNATIPLRIAGDLHHYARYVGDDNKSNLITCGGGGAFLHSTHPLPDTVALTKAETYRQNFKLQPAVFPTQQWCKDHRIGVFNLLQKNPRFSRTLGILYALYAWILGSASQYLSDEPGGGLLDSFNVRLCDLPGAWWDAVKYSPLAAIFTIVLLWGPYKYGVVMKRLGRSAVPAGIGGFLHGLCHLGIAVGLAWAAARIPVVKEWIVLALGGIAIVGGTAGGLLMAAYLFLSNWIYDAHDEEVFSCQAVEDYKCFTRFRLNAQGMTAFPIGLTTVPKDWKPAPGVTINKKNGGDEPIYELTVPDGVPQIFVPADDRKLQPHLIEPPIPLA